MRGTVLRSTYNDYLNEWDDEISIYSNNIKIPSNRRHDMNVNLIDQQIMGNKLVIISTFMILYCCLLTTVKV